jgi:tetratricopeptide (TPR) repeat protein
MAPEQIQGNPEFASDLFAVGLIGYLLFTRSHPFVDPTGLSRAGDRILSGHVIRQPRELSSAIPRHIDAALLKLLQHSPAERYRSAADAIIELEPPKARCEKCGAEISQKDNFCKQCGVKIDKKVEESAQPPTRVQADSAAADALSQRGYYKTRHGDLEGGIEDYRAAIQRDGQFARAYQNLGWALNRLGRFEEALDILNRAVELEPKNAIALKYRSYSHQQLDDYEASAEDLTLALKLSPEDTELLSLRAQCYARLRDYAKAQADLNQLLKLDPDNDRGLRLRERLVHLLPFNPIRGVSS